MGLDVCVRMSLRKLECKSASLVMIGGESLLVFRIRGQVLSPPTGGSALVNIMSGILYPSTTLRPHVSASSLCVTIVCDLTLPICVLCPMLSLVWMMSSAICRRCLRGWWMKLSGSMAYLRTVLMMKAISVRIEMVWSSLFVSSARVIAASSARFIVCLSSWDIFQYVW